ncbi:MAG: hypothetical protein IJ526_01855 [Lachnospiraceae bacterium]|nr:hypothetical protein [Lachnospiraceae bacterium]
MKSVSGRAKKDGPTSVIMRLDSKQVTIFEGLRKWKRELRRKSIEKNIRPGIHNITDVCEYLVDKYGFKEINKDSSEWNDEYIQMRTGFMIQYRPVLMGASGQELQSEVAVGDSVEKLKDKINYLQSLAKDVPTSEFDINLRMFTRENKGNEYISRLRKHTVILAVAQAEARKLSKSLTKCCVIFFYIMG